MCMTRLGFEMNEHLHGLTAAGVLPRGSRGYRKSDRVFVIAYGREAHQVTNDVARAYTQRLREGFRGRHDDLA
jgi:phosphotransferase system IIB component